MEPKNRLVLWVRVPVVVLTAGTALLLLRWAATLAGIGASDGYVLGEAGICLVGALTILAPVRQRISLICDGKPVVLTTSIGLLGRTFRRTRICWSTETAQGKLRGPDVCAISQWLNIDIGGDESIPLRIYKPPLKSFFVAFPGSGLKQFQAQLNSYLWL